MTMVANALSISSSSSSSSSFVRSASSFSSCFQSIQKNVLSLDTLNTNTLNIKNEK